MGFTLGSDGGVFINAIDVLKQRSVYGRGSLVHKFIFLIKDMLNIIINTLINR
jgi:hypothetical protein